MQKRRFSTGLLSLQPLRFTVGLLNFKSSPKSTLVSYKRCNLPRNQPLNQSGTLWWSGWASGLKLIDTCMFTLPIENRHLQNRNALPFHTAACSTWLQTACFLGVDKLPSVVDRLCLSRACNQPGELWHPEFEQFLLPLPASMLSLFRCIWNRPLWSVPKYYCIPKLPIAGFSRIFTLVALNDCFVNYSLRSFAVWAFFFRCLSPRLPATLGFVMAVSRQATQLTMFQAAEVWCGCEFFGFRLCPFHELLKQQKMPSFSLESVKHLWHKLTDISFFNIFHLVEYDVISWLIYIF